MRIKYSLRRVFHTPLLLTSLVLTACSGDTPQDPVRGLAGTNEPVNTQHDRGQAAQYVPQNNRKEANLERRGLNQSALALVNGKPVYRADLSGSLALKLYDLERAKYELTREALKAHLASKNSEGKYAESALSIDVLMEPPMPPRLANFDSSSAQDIDRQPRSGQQQAPIIISVFCNYQSSHCGKMQQVYQELEQLYPAQLSFVYYDFPQTYHRYSSLAAYAARCVQQSDKAAMYRLGLWASQDNLKRDRLLGIAEQLGIAKEVFLKCIDSDAVKRDVNENEALARQLGFSNVPVTLVNGLYVSGPEGVDMFRFLIDKELQRLGLQDSIMASQSKAKDEHQIKLVESQLPLRFEGFMSQQTGGDGELSKTAHIRHLDVNQLKDYTQDDEILEGVFLVMIEAERVVLENKGQLEFLKRQATSEHVGQYDEETVLSQMSELVSDVVAGEEKEAETEMKDYRAIPEEIKEADNIAYTPRPIVASQGVLPLSKEWVAQQLLSQAELESNFKRAAHEVEGVHLLKLKGVNNSEFYQTLGLREGDAVMRVNGEWVHEQQNNLFEVLENESHLSIVLMRKGLPVHLEYAIR